jgi:hypothetical protein
MNERFTRTYKKYNNVITNSIITGVVLLSGLAWNDVIQSTINKYYPPEKKQDIQAKLVYALIITLFVVLAEIYIFPRMRGDEN